MRKFLSGFFATGLALATAVTGVMPVAAAPRTAAPVSTPIAAIGDAAVTPVQFNRRDARRYRELRRAERRSDRRLNRFERRRDGYYYRGYRGYRDRRAGYRYHNGYWFPAAAFLAGALATGAIVDANRNRASAGSAHVQWCANRYRSYRASDNTFQPYNGPRQQCRSPY
ncbi:MAG: BA14K family protein [Methylobacterium mesophilicum]|nr:BA14K family protein [Methylobacterium mesophilicum]